MAWVKRSKHLLAKAKGAFKHQDMARAWRTWLHMAMQARALSGREGQAKQKEMQMQQMKKEMLKGILTVDARARLDRIRVVKPDKAGALENFILQRKARAIDEKQLIQLLDQMNQQIGETKVIRSRVQFSDSDDDNDDDLM